MKRRNDSVDIAQQTAPSFAEDAAQDKREASDLPEWALEQAERIANGLKRQTGFGFLHDPQAMEEFIEGTAAQLAGVERKQPDPQPEQEEKPFDQNSFFGDVKEMQAEYDKKHRKL